MSGAQAVDRAGDHENANQFLARHRDDVRYVPATRTWLRWDGAWWREDAAGEVLELARETIDDLRSWVVEADGGDEFKRRARHYQWSTTASRRESLLAVASTQANVPVRIDDLDRPRHLLACRNGTVDLRTGELRPARREDLLTRGVEVHFDPDASSTTWDAFVARIFADDAGLIRYVRALLGYAATGEVREHVLPIFHGTGANGKSTLLGAITAVLGAHAVTAAEGLLVETPAHEHPERLADLRGRRLVVSSELEARSVLAEGLVKALTGGDRISARYMYGARFDFAPTHTLVVVTNHLPRVRGTDEAIWRRLRMVPFAVTIPPAERVPDFASELVAKHGSAILAWLVRGAVDYYAHGLPEAPAVAEATGSYRGREDLFAQWLAEATVAIAGRSRVRDLRNAWVPWAKAAGASPGRDQDFVDALQSHGVEVERGRTSWARGRGLLDRNRSDQEECTPQHPSGETFLVNARMEKFRSRGVEGCTSAFAPSLSSNDEPLLHRDADAAPAPLVLVPWDDPDAPPHDEPPPPDEDELARREPTEADLERWAALYAQLEEAS